MYKAQNVGKRLAPSSGVIEYVALRCPMCDRKVGRAANESGVSYVELRCHSRACEAQPVTTFRIADGRASPYGLIDRHARRRVKSA